MAAPGSRPSANRTRRDPGTFACAIAVMAKASSPGRTKTRLSPPLFPAEAASFNTAFLQDVAANLLAAGLQAEIDGFMAYGPPGSDAFFEPLMPPEIGLFEVWLPNFGDCLFAAADTLLGDGYPAVCLLNSDSPTLPTGLLVEAATALARPGDRAVLGPSSDGGYYLLGLKHAHRRLFQDIAWSTETVATETLQRIAELGLPLHRLPTWYDVDDADALRLLRRELDGADRFDAALAPNRAVHSAALFDRLLAETDIALRLQLA